MKRIFLLFVCLIITFPFLFAQTPALGTYPATIIATASGNAVVNPAAAPAGATGFTAFTSLNFKGQLFVNQTTGAVSVVNAYPAGAYTISIKAFNGAATATSSFLLTVGNSSNCQPLFSTRPTLTTGTNSSPAAIAIGDFNNDGLQDFATANNGSGTVSIRLGNDTFGFAPLITTVSLGRGPQDLAVADFNEDGIQDIVVAHFDSAQLVILSGNGVGGFTITRKVSIPGNPVSVAVADFNRDGHPDVAAVTYNTNSIVVRLNDGIGNFSGSFSIGVGPRPTGLSLADFNRDGNIDFVVANFDSNNLSVGLGNGTGGFSTPFLLSARQYPYSTVVDDFNNDGNPDIVAGYTTNSFSVSVYLGNGAGGFTSTTSDVNSYQTAIRSGDFNGDGKQDLAIVYQSGNRLFIAAGNGTGGFAINTSDVMNTGSTPSALAIGDFNQDGRQDIAASNGFSSSITVRWGNVSEIDVLGNGVSIADGDTTPSVADSTDFGILPPGTRTQRTYLIRNTGPAPLRINSITLSGADSAQFTKSATLFPVVVAPGSSFFFIIGFSPTSPGLKTTMLHINNTDCDEADYDFKIEGTGMAVMPTIGNYAAATVLTAGGNITIIPSAPPTRAGGITATTSPVFKGTFAVDTATGIIKITNAYPSGTYFITVTAFNGTAFVTRSFTLTVGNTLCSQGLFASATTQKVGSLPYAVCVGDFNLDGNQDLAVVNSSGNSVSIRLGNGSGGFAAAADVVAPNNPVDISTGDVNSDGKPDLLITSSTTNVIGTTIVYILVLTGNGTGGFTLTSRVPVPNRPDKTVTGDFNNDGRLDFAAASQFGGSIYPFIGDGVGNFTAATPVGGFGILTDVATGDFNNDGITDLVAIDNYSVYAIRLGDGTGNFTGNTFVQTGNSPYFVTVADVNKDGNADFLTGSNFSVLPWLGDGGGNFTRGILLPVLYANKITTADVNGDSNPDIVALSGYRSGASIYAGDGTGAFAFSDSVQLGPFTNSVAIGDVNADGWQDIIATSRDNDSMYIAAGKPNEIDVRGNGISIAAADTIPSFTDSTDFGKVVITTRPSRRYFIHNTGAVPLTISAIQLIGTGTASFRLDSLSLPLVVPANSYQPFTITFMATDTGVKKTFVRIINNDCDETVYDFAIQGTARDAGASLDFDGTDDYIMANNNTGNVDTAGLTISAWVKTASSGMVNIMSKGNPCTAGSYFSFGINASGRLYLDLNDLAGHHQYLSGSTSVNNNNWHHVAATRSGTRLSLYVDGQLDTTWLSLSVASVSNTAYLLVGASSCGSDINFFNGQMDELKLYSRSLSIGEIQTHIYCELSGIQNGLLLYYKFNQGLVVEDNSGINTAVDSSGNINSGQLNGFSLSGVTSNWAAPGGVMTGITCTSRSIWLGFNRNWDDPTNWSGGFVPSSFTKVIINNDKPFMPQITSPNSACYSLTVNNGATITVKTGGYLNITANN